MIRNVDYKIPSLQEELEHITRECRQEGVDIICLDEEEYSRVLIKLLEEIELYQPCENHTKHKDIFYYNGVAFTKIVELPVQPFNRRAQAFH